MQTLGGQTVLSTSPQTEPTQSQIAGFLDFIGNPETSIPLNSNFGIQFNIPTLVRGEEYTGFEAASKAWAQLASKREYLVKIQDSSSNFMGSSSQFCVFANGVVLPQESFGVERHGFDGGSGGILKGMVSSSREDPKTLTMTFLETEYSYIDFIIRPWIMLSSHLGLFARDEPWNIKTDITVFMFSRFGDGQQRDPQIRKAYFFKDCVPINVTDSGYAKHDFGINDKMNVATIEWAYNYYAVSNGTAVS